MLNRQLQQMNTRRQVVRVFCKDTGIPLKDMMAILDMDYASKAQTYGLDTDDSESTLDRHVNVGLVQTVKKLVSLK